MTTNPLEQTMIELYSWPTPNGHKIHIMLEECGLKYHVTPVDIGAGEQFKPEFLRISPNNKIPALVDSDGPDGKPISLFESGAILLYLAGKAGRFLGNTDREKYNTLQWLMFQMASVGPMLGQSNHFRNYAPQPIPYAIDRYTNEARRIYSVMDKQLAQTTYLAGNQYTIADIATFPWARSSKNQYMDWSDFPHVQRWFDLISKRPAVQRGLKVLADLRKPLTTKEAKDVLFGSAQYQYRK
jgi:GSH-dependent disulfide-bond oxidoreductase